MFNENKLLTAYYLVDNVISLKLYTIIFATLFNKINCLNNI